MKRTAFLLALLISSAAACGGSGSGSGASGSGAAASGSGAATAAPQADDNAPEEPGVKVLDKGAAPAQKLRYQPADGAVETILLVQTRSEAFVGEKPRSVPASKLTIVITVKGKTPTGDREATYEIKDAVVEQDSAVPSSFAAQVQQFLKKAIGTGGKFVVSDRGAVRKVEPTVPAGADALMKQFGEKLADSMQVAVVTLPAAAIGVGARWEHARDTRQSGITVKAVSTYEVTAINGDEVKLKITDSQKADKQSMDPGDGHKIEVSNYKSDGSGEITLSLKRLTPRAASVKNQGSMTMEGLGKGAKEIRLTTSVTLTGT